MAKVILMRSQGVRFLVESDEQVVLPPGLPEVVGNRTTGVAEGMQPVSDLGLIERSFDQVRDVITACSRAVVDAVVAVASPDKVAVEFGIKLAGEAGIPLITRAGSEANFKISIEWGRRSTKKATDG